MEPNFFQGDYLIIDELSYQFRAPERGEVIVLKYPQDPSQRYIKRIIGLPGETVEITYQYLLPFRINLNRDSESYSLMAQKQAGSAEERTCIYPRWFSLCVCQNT